MRQDPHVDETPNVSIFICTCLRERGSGKSTTEQAGSTGYRKVRLQRAGKPKLNDGHRNAPALQGTHYEFTTVTMVLTELAMKQFSWAAWCILSSSAAVGIRSPLHVSLGRN